MPPDAAALGAEVAVEPPALVVVARRDGAPVGLAVGPDDLVLTEEAQAEGVADHLLAAWRWRAEG